MMRATFVLTCYNQARFIEEALHGFFHQDYPNIQRIIVDDCSTDHSVSVIDRFLDQHNRRRECLFLRSPVNRGIVGTLNSAIAASDGDVIVFAAGDDVSTPQHVSAVVKHFQHSGASLVAVNPIRMMEDGTVIGPVYKRGYVPPTLEQAIARGSCGVPGVGSAWARDVFDKYGPMPGDIVNEDDHLPFRALLLRGVSICDAPVVYYRLNASSLSSWLWKDVSSEREYVARFLRNQSYMLSHYRHWLRLWDASGMPSDHRRRALVRRIEFFEAAVHVLERPFLVRLHSLGGKFGAVTAREYAQLVGGQAFISGLRFARRMRNAIAAVTYRARSTATREI